MATSGSGSTSGSSSTTTSTKRNTRAAKVTLKLPVMPINDANQKIALRNPDGSVRRISDGC